MDTRLKQLYDFTIVTPEQNRPAEAPLTELQLRIITALWRLGEGTIVDVHEELRPEVRTSQATVATLLSRLAQRRLVSRHRVSRAFVYRPLLTEDRMGEQVTSEFVDRTRPLFGGRLGALVASLVDDSDLTEGDLDEAERILSEARERLERGESKE